MAHTETPAIFINDEPIIGSWTWMKQLTNPLRLRFELKVFDKGFDMLHTLFANQEWFKLKLLIDGRWDELNRCAVTDFSIDSIDETPRAHAVVVCL